jgi:hypothetical protein
MRESYLGQEWFLIHLSSDITGSTRAPALKGQEDFLSLPAQQPTPRVELADSLTPLMRMFLVAASSNRAGA